MTLWAMKESQSQDPLGKPNQLASDSLSDSDIRVYNRKYVITVGYCSRISIVSAEIVRSKILSISYVIDVMTKEITIIKKVTF